MKQIKYIILCLCLIFSFSAEAQLAQGRTNSTIIADALAQLPAETPQQYNAVISDLVTTGEEGLLDLIGRMNPPGTETNEAYDFAISGWSHFVSKDDTKRAVAANAFEKALSRPLDKEVKAFVIRQLRTVGSNNNVEALSSFLNDDYLSGTATAALVSIGTESANEELLKALAESNSEVNSLHFANALGQTGYTKSEPVLLNLLNSNPSEKMRGVLLKALAEVGGKESVRPLRNAAENIGLEYEKSGAVASYINLLSRLNASEHKIVSKEANRLLSRTKKQNKNDLKIAATKLLLDLPSSNTSKILGEVIKDGDLKYLTNILHVYPFENDKKSVDLILKEVSKTKSSDIQTALTYWLGEKQPEGAAYVIIPFVGSSNKMVQKAATQSLSKIGGEESLLTLAGLLKSSDDESVTLAKNALMSFNGDISYTLASVYESSDDEGKKAILELISNRKMESQYNLVYNQMFSDNQAVKTAAASTLKNVVTDKNLNDLFVLLEQSDEEYTSAIQHAINTGLSDLPQEDQTKLVSERISKSNKKHLYYSALAGIGSSESIEQLNEAYNKETGANREAAFRALSNINSFHVIYPILDIARNTNKTSELDKITTALIDIISRSDVTDAIKYLYLREAMEFAQNDKQRNRIIELLGTTNQYQAMLYVAPFMDNAALSEAAAVSAMNIALSNSSFAGEETTNILNKVSKTLSNPDADYQRQSITKHLSENETEGGFTSLFNGENLDGWKGLVANPIKRAEMSSKELAAAQAKADAEAKESWIADNGILLFTGKGNNLCTEKQYGDFEMLVDWKLYEGPEPDAGIYLRGTPQVQIWDTARVNVGAQVGSGGLYNNKVHESKPLKVADQKLGEWNTFRIRMVGERVSVWLNDELVTDNVVLENFWDRSQPIFPVEQIELQAHGSEVAYRDIYIKEIPRPEPFKLSEEEEAEGFKILFDGTNLDQWTGNKADYAVESGTITVYPGKSKGTTRNLYTNEEFDNFVFRFEFMLTPGANNGLGIRTPMEGDAAYVGMELQILDNDAPIYENLQIHQYHGSVYGVIPAERGALKPLGEWNYQEVIADGDNIKIILNGTTILDGNIREASKDGTMDGREHPGLLNEKGHIGFLGHGSQVKFRNIRIKEL